MAIEVKKIETGYAVKFPFELKDNFKSVFKTAKWNPVYKQWEVGVRSYKKLVEWTEAAESVNAELDTAKQQEEDEADLLSAKAELQTIKNAIIARNKTQEEWLAILASLEGAKLEILAARAELKAKETEILKTREQVQNFLYGVIDFGCIHEAKVKMARFHHTVGAVNSDQFHQAKNIIRAEQEKLAAVGFRSAGLDYLASVNYNRPDRDKIEYTPDLLLITPLEHQD